MPLYSLRVCSGRLYHSQPFVKWNVPYQSLVRHAGVTTSRRKLRCGIACCQHRNSGPSATGTDDPDNDKSYKGKMVSGCLYKAAQLFAEGETLLDSGQVREGTERLKTAQDKAAEAKTKLAITVGYSDRVDLNNSSTDSLSDEQLAGALRFLVGATLLTVWSFGGALIGVGLVSAVIVGIAVTSLSTISEYMTQPNISRMLVWYAILLVAVPQALVVYITRKTQTSLFGASMNGAQAMCYRLIANLATGADVPFMTKEENSSEFRQKVTTVLQLVFALQMFFIQIQSSARDEANMAVKKNFKKIGINVDDYDIDDL